MSYFINNQQKVNDIIFKNRNKSYGAYAIRSSYGNTVFKSLAFMFLGFGTIMAVAFYFSNRPGDQNLNIGQVLDQDSVYTVPLDMTPKKPEPQTQQPKQHNASSSSAGISTNVSDTASVVTNTPTDISNTGVGTAITGVGEGTTTATTGSFVSNNTVTVEADPVPIPDTAPEFEGGLKALYAFLGSKLRYPELAREIGKQGIVYVKFVVDQNGKVGNLKLLNNLGYGLDEEALRVVGLIPDFKTPGKVGGRAVKVYYQLPIKFSMN
jgi:protein TonB